MENVEYKRIYQRGALKQTVVAEAYPPSITVKVMQSKVPERLINHKFIHLFVSGTTSGPLTFPMEVIEEKESEFVNIVYGTCLSEEGLCLLWCSY